MAWGLDGVVGAVCTDQPWHFFGLFLTSLEPGQEGRDGADLVRWRADEGAVERQISTTDR
jgi:hypothetical protein